MSLEAAAVSARGGFACLFSSSDEYETALIMERRAQGRYATSLQPLAAADVLRLHRDGRRHRAPFQLKCREPKLTHLFISGLRRALQQYRRLG